MADSTDRPKRPGGPPTGKRPDSGRPAKGAPSSGRTSSPRTGGNDRPNRDGERPAWQKRDAPRSDAPRRDGDRAARPARDGERRDVPRRDGDRPAWQKRDGDRPARPARDGDQRDAPRRAGDKPAWQKRDAPRGDSDRRDAPRRDGDRPAWQNRDGDRPARPVRDGDRREAPRRDGDKPAWQKRDGDRPSRPARDGDKPAWQKRDGDRPARPARDGDKPAWQKRDGERPARPARASDKPAWQKREDQSGGARGRRDEPRLWTREGSPARGDSSASARELPEDRDPYGTKSVRTHHDAPEIPEEIQPNQLDRVARAQLKTLSKENADEVARHMVMAASLIVEDPVLAHAHAMSAGRRAGRIAVVRETLAITAYSIGDFALALRELRTYRRISGRDDQLPMMVDCERGLGRPEKALELGRSVPRAGLPAEVQVELAIAMSGARLDLGQMDAALVELQIPQLDPDTAFSWSPALFDAYAAVLEDLGRTDEAETWFNRSDLATAALSSDDEADDLEIEVFEELGDEDPDDEEFGDAPGGLDDSAETAHE